MVSVALLIALVSLLLLKPPWIQEHHAAEGHEWAYSGAEGPEHWGDVRPENGGWKVGQEQAPIGIRSAEKAELPAIEFNYKTSPLKIVNNGHTIQINYAPGSKISVAGKEYEVVQFHFHHPSEEKIQGQGYDMVTHIVHKDSEGRLAVVAVLMKTGHENPFVQSLWAHLPRVPGKEQAIENASVNIADLLPAGQGYYTFAPSLTPPPCTAAVRSSLL